MKATVSDMARVCLGDVAYEVKQKAPESAQLPTVGLEHLDPDEIELSRWDENAETTFTKGFSKGQMLFGRRRAYLRKAAVAPFDGVCSGDITVIATKEGLSPRLLPFVIQNEALFEHAVTNSAGSLSPRVKWQGLSQFEFELPASAKQEELADILWAAQETRGRYKQLLAACDDVVKSQFVEMFGGPEAFEAAPNTVKDVAKLRVGIVIKPSRFYAATGTGTPAFRSLNIGPMRVQNSDWIEFTDEAMRVNTRTVAHEGDVLIVRSGYPGTSCVVTAEFAGRNVVDLIIATPDRDKILPEFLCAYLNYPPGKSQIERMQHGVAQQHFNVGMCEKLRLRIPPLSHQKEFANFAAQIDKSKFAVQKALDELNATTKKILNQELGLGDV